MKTTIRLIPLVLACLVTVLPLHSQQQAPSPSPTFATPQLEQMVAPIALYPDALVAQVLAAATYPLEVVEADRWVEKNPNLKGKDLEEALKPQEWDPSVKALCAFPTVLKDMSDNLAWTRDLGDAYLSQKTELMDTVQTMRRKAVDAGNLKTTPQQEVREIDKVVVIQSASPEVIYVPAYSPVVVYGPGWYYPSWYYPWWYAPPAPGFGFVSFGIGFSWGFGACWDCNWHSHCVDVNGDRFDHFTSATSLHPTNSNHVFAQWQHDPAHRVGTPYRSSEVAQHFGAVPGSRRVSQGEAMSFHPPAPGRGFERAPVEAGARLEAGSSGRAWSDASPQSSGRSRFESPSGSSEFRSSDAVPFRQSQGGGIRGGRPASRGVRRSGGQPQR